ncbi:MAG: hypothetical protein GY797_09965 [Deltaproteobacteria bacterium]|nr:hypothetical protein [Deltaproteobacteria bacterium]
MFPNINEIKMVRKKYNWQMRQSGIKTFREIEELEVNALKDGALAQKYKLLSGYSWSSPVRYWHCPVD